MHDVLGALGLEIHDLFPERQCGHAPPERRPFPAADALRCVAFEASVVLMSAAKLGDEMRPLPPCERERLAQAVGRIVSALDASGVTL
ncbi:MAG: hypothetical protein FWG52_02095 [Proteobacteria bacterium]|nr:hypothetical protein [Pseudomonadota bacterium]